jgi:hypothetical protein
MDGRVLEAEESPDVIKELGMLTRGCFRQRVSWLLYPERVENRHRATRPDNPSHLPLSEQKGL